MHLDLIPAALHRMAVAFLMTTGLSQPQKMDVLEWMVKFGSPEGRLAATEVLKELDEANVQDVVRDGLDSKEPEVQAWATGQLRAWSIPNAMELLVERIDSPVPEVRQAARGELAGFDVRRLLEIFDQLDSRMRTIAGNLVQKIDPEALPKLKGEMLTAIRSKRIRAARAALTMNLHRDVADALLEMARDSDTMVRRTAAEVLGKVHSREALDMLRELTRDSSPRVRETAAAALDEVKAARDPAQSTSREVRAEPVARLETLT
jgi:HEAT repeat protein